MIRDATKEDFSAIELHAARFWQETEFDEPYQSGSALFYMNIAFDQELLIVAERDGKVIGFAAGCYSPLMGDNSILAGTEMAWWIDPLHRNSRDGIGLLKGLESKAKKVGCKYWNMVSLESSMPQEIQKIYHRMGYLHTESSFMKRL